MSKLCCATSASNKIRTDDHAHDYRGGVFAYAVGKPPHRALAHAPGSVLLGKQKSRNFTERGLMADNEHRLSRIGPAGCRQNRANRSAGRELGHGPEFALQRESGLLRAVGWAHQYSAGVRKMTVEPGRHSFGLLDAFGRESAAKIRLAWLGLGMAPQNQVHGECREFIAPDSSFQPAGRAAPAAPTWTVPVPAAWHAGNCRPRRAPTRRECRRGRA